MKREPEDEDAEEGGAFEGLQELALGPPLTQGHTPTLAKRARKTGRQNARGPRRCRLCLTMSSVVCPIRGQPHLLEWPGGRHENGTPKGPVCFVCLKVQHADPSLASKSVLDLEEEFRESRQGGDDGADGEVFDNFMAKREQCIAILKEQGLRCHVSTLSSKLNVQTVKVEKAAGERLLRNGTLYRKDIWETMPESKDGKLKVEFPFPKLPMNQDCSLLVFVQYKASGVGLVGLLAWEIHI